MQELSRPHRSNSKEQLSEVSQGPSQGHLLTSLPPQSGGRWGEGLSRPRRGSGVGTPEVGGREQAAQRRGWRSEGRRSGGSLCLQRSPHKSSLCLGGWGEEGSGWGWRVGWLAAQTGSGEAAYTTSPGWPAVYLKCRVAARCGLTPADP